MDLDRLQILDQSVEVSLPPGEGGDLPSERLAILASFGPLCFDPPIQGLDLTVQRLALSIQSLARFDPMRFTSGACFGPMCFTQSECFGPILTRLDVDPVDTALDPRGGDEGGGEQGDTDRKDRQGLLREREPAPAVSRSRCVAGHEGDIARALTFAMVSRRHGRALETSASIRVRPVNGRTGSSATRPEHRRRPEPSSTSRISRP